MNCLEIRMTTDGRGRGLFTTTCIKSRRFIFEEDAIAAGRPTSDIIDDFDGHRALVNEVTSLIQGSQHVNAKLQLLHGGCNSHTVPSVAQLQLSAVIQAAPGLKADQIERVCSQNAYAEVFQVSGLTQSESCVYVSVPFLYFLSSFINEGDADEWNVHRVIKPDGRISWFSINDIDAGSQLLTCYGLDRTRLNLPKWSPEMQSRNNARAMQLSAEGIDI